MTAISFANARENLAIMMDKVCLDRDPVIITRDGPMESVVMIPLSEFESIEETAYLLRSPQNANRLREAVQQLNGGQGTERSLEID